MMDKNPVVEYLSKEIADQEDKLNKSIQQKGRVEKKIEELQQSLGVLRATLEKALSEFEIHDQEYIDRVIKVEGRLEVKPTPKITISEAAYEILSEFENGLHVNQLTKKIADRGVEFTAKKPIASVTSALLRDDRFRSLGRGTGRWTIKRESTDETTYEAANNDSLEDDDIDLDEPNKEHKNSAAVAQLG